jgi:ATP phosphoribosyltransferase-like protein
MNVTERPERVMSLLPAMHSPTISALSDEGWYDLDVVIDEKTVCDYS